MLDGDIWEPDLGLDGSTWQRLAGSVDLIVHPAAHVNHVLPYNQLFAGHDHTYAHAPAQNQTIVGNGGAPSATTLGFLTVEQQPGLGFKVTAYDYATAQPYDVWYFQ